MPAKTDNGDVEGKVLVRTEALRAAPSPPKVLDCYAGEGHMFKAAWAGASEYLGIDQRFSRRVGDPAGRCWRGNNAMLIGKAMAVAPWDIVDLDAYANAWPLLRQVLKLSKSKQLVVTLTCGMDRAIRCGASDFAAAVAGASKLSYLGVMTRWYDDIARWALQWAIGSSGFKVERCRRTIGVHNLQMRYFLFEFRRGARRDLRSPPHVQPSRPA